MEGSPDIPRRLPRGSHGLDRGLVAASQRTRILEAVGRAVAQKGYAAATIDDIVRGAGVSKKTFYEHFSDKEDCFLAAYEAAADELFARVREAQAAPGPWLERTRAGISAYLRWLAAEPALARVFLIEVAAAGPRAAERREALRDRYAEQLAELQRNARDELPGLPEPPVGDLPGGGGGGGRPGGAAHPRGRRRGADRARAHPRPPSGVAPGRSRGGRRGRELMTVRVEESVRIARSPADGRHPPASPFLGAIVHSGLKSSSGTSAAAGPQSIVRTALPRTRRSISASSAPAASRQLVVRSICVSSLPAATSPARKVRSLTAESLRSTSSKTRNP